MTAAAPVMPPHSLEAEQAICGAVMLQAPPDAELFSECRAEMFYSEAHRRIWSACEHVYAESGKCDVVEVAQHLRGRDELAAAGGAAALNEIINSAPIGFEARRYARIVRDAWRVRECIATAQRIVAEGYHTAMADPSAYVERAQTSMMQATTSGATVDIVPMHVAAQSAAREVAKRMQLAAKGASAFPSTGFPNVDRIILGLQPGRLYVIAARPGVGKSAVALSMARTLSRNTRQPVLFCSFEMHSTEIAERALAEASSVPLTDLQTGRLRGGADYASRLDLGLKHLARENVLFVDDANMTAFDIAAQARRIHAQHKSLAAVFVDYIQLVRAVQAKGDSRENAVNQLTMQLKRLALSMEIPVVGLSQLNRKVEERSGSKTDARPKLSDLRESGAIEQHADCVMLIHRPRTEGEPPKLIPHEVIVAKSRNTRQGIALLHLEREFVRFTSAADDVEEP